MAQRTGKCERCGKIRSLVKNHKNGRHEDNSAGNVEYICDDCHARYHQYPKGKNSGVHIGGN